MVAAVLSSPTTPIKQREEVERKKERKKERRKEKNPVFQKIVCRLVLR